MFKKILLMLFILIAICIIGLLIFIKTNPLIPSNTDALIAEIQQEPLPDLIKGKTGFAKNGAVSIWYEVQSKVDTPKGTVLLIMGYGTTGLNWPSYFCEPFLVEGYQVIRYDNRGVGESSWMENWNKKEAYLLEDMAKDAIAILDHLGIQKVHVAGVSMGGMIAQRMAISHANRVLSLTSIMSTGNFGDPDLTQLSTATLKKMVKINLNYNLSASLDNQLKYRLAVGHAIKGNGDYLFDDKASLQKSLYEIKKRRGFNEKVAAQHDAAIRLSGSRYGELEQIKVPTLVIHGKSDPLILFEHALKYAPMIADTKMLWIDGMGHDLPEAYAPKMTKAMINIIGMGEVYRN